LQPFHLSSGQPIVPCGTPHRINPSAPAPAPPSPPPAHPPPALQCARSVKGYPTGFGNPTWLETHPAPATAHCPPVQAMLDAGAMLVGVLILVHPVAWVACGLFAAICCHSFALTCLQFSLPAIQLTCLQFSLCKVPMIAAPGLTLF